MGSRLQSRGLLGVFAFAWRGLCWLIAAESQRAKLILDPKLKP